MHLTCIAVQMQPVAQSHGGELIPVVRSAAVNSTAPAASTSGAAKSLYVGNLSCFVTEVTLHDIFSTLGKIAECKVIKDKQTGLPAGYAFVRFEDHRSVHCVHSEGTSFGQSCDGLSAALTPTSECS